jgi:DNA-binding LacI/PurR family transcriptional regulator
MSNKPVKNIEDIARLANVSKSTVSRSLNDSPLIKQETKERIQAIARENDFCLNQSARTLSTHQAQTVAFVTHAYYTEHFSIEDLFGLEIMGGVGSGLYGLGYDLLVIHVNHHDTEWAHKYLDSGRVDGFILMTSTRKQKHLKTLADAGAPFIVWGFPPEKYDCCSVIGDDAQGGMLATEHLIHIGRKHIGFIGGPADEVEVQHRYKGYEAAMQAAGFEIDPRLVVHGDYSHASGIYAMQQLLEQSPEVDAVFANSDLMAIGAINVIQNSGKRVPEDISVVGYDDLSIANYNNLPLTTISQKIPLAGMLLAQNLVQYIQTGLVTHVTIPVELVVRQSA